jgi:GH15 family glucan-1,4-alpha-glucosidase
MARPVILSNNHLAVGLNERGLVHDFYYPYVGLDNLTTARSMNHKIGVWVDNTFSWVDSHDWDSMVDFEHDALVSSIKLTNSNLGLELTFTDFVDSQVNAFIRQVKVTNTAKEKREIRIFFHQVFQISNEGTSDTALYEPTDKYILDYKGRCSLLIYTQSKGKACDQFAVGNYGIEGKHGTYMDAEDGELSGSAVEHGGVDSVLRISNNVPALSSVTVDYWIVASDSQFNAERIHNKIKENGVESLLQKTRKFWSDWLAIAEPKLQHIDSSYQNICKKSLMLIKAHTDKDGGIIASADSSIYNYGRDYYSYVWPRDGAYAMWPLIRMGYREEPKKFFEFCNDILTDDGYLMHKYQPDKAIGSTWHPLLHGQKSELGIQEDETAVVIFMLGEYIRHSGDKEFAQKMYGSLVRPAANFLNDFIDSPTSLPHASYDLWEEKFLTSTYTTAVTYRALITAASIASLFEHEKDAALWTATAKKMLEHSHQFYDLQTGYYNKGFLLKDDGSKTIDSTLDVSSFYGVITYGYFMQHDGQKIASTAAALEEQLLDFTPSGGIGRYSYDTYFQIDPIFRGNPWIVTTLWMSQYYIRMKHFDQAKKYIDWAISKASPSGILSEQINPSTSEPTSVAPLVWSHSELINTVLDYSDIS